MSQDPQTDRPPEFPAPSTSDWQKAAEKSLKGKPLSTLNWDTPEGIVVKPLYTAEDTADLPHTNTLPGFAPYIRGPPSDHVRGPALDDPPVRRLFDGNRIQRLLPKGLGRWRSRGERCL